MSTETRSVQPTFLADKIASTVGVALALGVIVQSLQYGLRSQSQVVGPGLFPFLLGVALLVISGVWAWQAWRGTVPLPAEIIELPDRSGLLRIGITSAVLLVSALLFEMLDFRLTLFLAPTIIMQFVFRSGWLRALATGAGVAIACHFILLVGLNIPLPTFQF